MYKHLEDKGDINVLVNTDGSALLVCSICGQKWFGNFEPVVEKFSAPQKDFMALLSTDQDLAESMNIQVDGERTKAGPGSDV